MSRGPGTRPARSGPGLRVARIAAAVLAGALAAQPAAAEVPPEDAALAEALFRAAKKRMAEHAYAEACPKLVESQRLDPGGGTLLTLALCHEGQGKTASAWAELKDALAAAQKDGRQDRIAVARTHAAALEARLSHLTVRPWPEAAAVPGIEVRCDDLLLAPAAWGIAVPVDPGPHHVSVIAPGKKPRTTEVVVAPEGAATVELDPLEDLPPPAPARVEPPPPEPVQPPPAPAPPPPPRLLDARGIAGIAVAGAGVLVIGGASYLGSRAFSLQGQANARCPGTACPDAGAVNLNAEARTAADLSTAGFVAGGVALAGGVLLVFVPRSRPRAVTLAPSATRAGGGLVAVGVW